MHGVGWAAGEQQGADAANLCDRAGSYSDSCILGVAYQSKRYEPAIAQSLCETARDPKERKRCLDFVTRKTSPGPQVGVP